MEGMTVVQAKIGLFIHPSRAANVQQGVREILNSLLLKYSEEFDGVVLGYLKPKILGKSARILSGLTPFFHVNVTAKLLVFSPSLGMLIEGKVNKIEKDYIGVVVLGLFNAAIGVSDIREDLYYNDNAQVREWVSESDERHSIRLGSILRFSVKSLQETEHIIDFCGSLADSKTGCVDWLELPALTPKKKSSKESSVQEGEGKHKSLDSKKAGISAPPVPETRFIHRAERQENGGRHDEMPRAVDTAGDLQTGLSTKKRKKVEDLEQSGKKKKRTH